MDISRRGCHYELFIIGGDRGSEVLLKNIRAVIPKIFKKNYQIFRRISEYRSRSDESGNICKSSNGWNLYLLLILID